MKEFDSEQYQSLCQRILDKAKQQGVGSAEVTLSQEEGFSVSSRLGQVETITHENNKGVSLTVYFDQKTGSASSTDLSDAAIDLTIEKACNIAKYTSADPYSGLADADQIAFHYPKVDIYYPWRITTEEALDIAIKCENLARQDKRITNSEGASVSSSRTFHVYGNTHGFVGSYPATQHGINCVLIAQEDGHMQRSYEYTVARDANDLMDIAELAEKSATKTISRLGARRLKTQSAPVLFSAEVARSLIGHLVAAMSGGNIYRQSSFLIDCLNQPIFPEHINLTQLPHLPKGMGSAPFDNEGVATIQQNFIEQGILKNYFLGSYSARKLGMKSTGNSGGIFNLQLSASDRSQLDLIKEMGRGLLVVELIGQGVNIVTGDYSRGVFGYWVEHGEIQFPVTEVTIAGNLKDIFQNVIAVANDIDKRSRVHTGSILIKEMMIAGE
jgi:PmbA protein